MTRVGIDIGGTFTDFVFADEEGKLFIDKEPSIPEQAEKAVQNGLGRRAGTKLEFISHGTTVGVNALLERKHQRTALLTTEGFRDIYEIGRHNRVQMYDLFYRKPTPLVARALRYEVTERIGPTGEIVVPLAEAQVDAAVDYFTSQDVHSVAIAFLHSYANPTHELDAARLIRERAPHLLVSCSHEVAREWREYERTSTVCINAYVLPLVSGYLEALETHLASRADSASAPLYISKSSGGLMSARAARDRPVHTIMSGPAGGATAAAYVGKLLNMGNLIALDMGGTSADVSLVHNGALQVVHEGAIERHPLLVPMIDITTIGAGGGSIAQVDTEGSLSVGPDSAGASPGPACYGRGGEHATVTDANVVLGRIDPHFFLGGSIPIQAEAAARAVQEKIGRPLDLDNRHAAEGIITIVNTKMAHAIRAVTVQRGLDPREFVLLAFGGAGPLHACAVAAELAIPEVVIPPAPGVFSALGMLSTDLRYEQSRTYFAPLDGLDRHNLIPVYDELRNLVQESLYADGITVDAISYELSVDLRYIGQEHTLTLETSDPAHLSRDSFIALKARFDQLHARTYGHASPSEAAEIVALRLVGVGALARVELAKVDPGPTAVSEASVRATRSVVFEGQSLDCHFIDRGSLLFGSEIVGPAVIEEPGSTTLVPPGFRLRVERHGTLHIRQEDD